MSKASIFVLIVSSILLFANNVSSQITVSATFRFALCRGDIFGNYTANSTYESNLITVLATLGTQASTSLFYNTSAGSGSDTVHGQYYCREDFGPTFCGLCIKSAALQALGCSNAKGAIIWYNECTLRYENASMYGIELERPRLRSWSLNNTEEDTVNLFNALNETMINLIDRAVNGNDSSHLSRYAVGSGAISGSENKVYCLVQCSLDMNVSQCDTCLRNAFVDLQTCCGEYPKWIYVFFVSSCQVMFDTRAPFFIDSNAPPPPASLPSTISVPPPSPSEDSVSVSQPPPPATNGASMVLVNNKSFKLGFIATTALVFLML